MKASKLTGILFIAGLLLSSTTTFAARPTPPPDGSGFLKGTVQVAGTRDAIAYATVTASGEVEPETTTTNSDGSYTLTLLAGDYNITATAGGYASQTFSATIRSGKTTKVNFFLSGVVSTEGAGRGRSLGEGFPVGWLDGGRALNVVRARTSWRVPLAIVITLYTYTTSPSVKVPHGPTCPGWRMPVGIAAGPD